MVSDCHPTPIVEGIVGAETITLCARRPPTGVIRRLRPMDNASRWRFTRENNGMSGRLIVGSRSTIRPVACVGGVHFSGVVDDLHSRDFRRAIRPGQPFDETLCASSRTLLVRDGAFCRKRHRHESRPCLKLTSSTSLDRDAFRYEPRNLPGTLNTGTRLATSPRIRIHRTRVEARSGHHQDAAR